MKLLNCLTLQGLFSPHLDMLSAIGLGFRTILLCGTLYTVPGWIMWSSGFQCVYLILNKTCQCVRCGLFDETTCNQSEADWLLSLLISCSQVVSISCWKNNEVRPWLQRNDVLDAHGYTRFGMRRFRQGLTAWETRLHSTVKVANLL